MNSKTVFLTYTCPVSRFTFAGHPSHGTLYEHSNDLKDAVNRIKRLAKKHGQPVSWVINDQEYLNLEGLLPDFIQWQSEGDSILVTMELTTSPAEVDKKDTASVIKWIADKCKQAGFTPDGFWSLKFFESDLAAISTLSKDDYPWTRNLAGSCWHQEGIDDSTWLGVPYGPYFPSLWNTKAPAAQDEPQEFLMLEWLTRDICACLTGGFPATFSLDPADANRKDAGGFKDEVDALRYSNALISETVRQIAFNETVVVNINEEARHYQTEGHDKDLMLDGMFGHFARTAGDSDTEVDIRQVGYKEVWKHYRSSYPQTPDGLFVAEDLDWRRGTVAGASERYNNRIPGDRSVLYQDTEVQLAFVRTRGPIPVEFYDYTQKHSGDDQNTPYPSVTFAPLQLREQSFDKSGDTLEVTLSIFSSEEMPEAAFMLWEAPIKGSETVTAFAECVKMARATPAGLLVRMKLNKGETTASIRVQD